MGNDGYFMRRALQIAARPLRTAPNPRVGAVVVRNGRILKEAAHEGAGTPHAEALALEGIDATDATLYVNLEPCVHQGRMPPCAPVVVGAGVARVVIAQRDPDDRVNGAGVTALQEAGIEVTEGVLAVEALAINRAYLHHRTTGRPWVTLKLALSIDGRLGPSNRDSRWITGDDARWVVHRRRAEADAILIGAGSILTDDPQLTARDVGATTQPTRVVVDASGRIPQHAAIFAGGGVIIATTDASSHDTHTAWKEAGAETLVLPGTENGVDLDALFVELGRRGFTEVYCEGGAELATSLFKGELVDRLEIHHGPMVLGRGGPEIGDLGVLSMSDAPRWKTMSAEQLGDDVVIVWEKG